jgi:type I restriction enzyme M protein
MLDNETKRRIDTARDILVGKVPDPKSQVEQITIALVYKFMDDMDKEAVELGGKPSFFTGDYERYAWNKIFDPRIGGHEMLLLYGEAIVKLNQNPNLPQLFRDIFKNAYLPYRDPETLKLFLKTINEFSYDHSERLGDAFEYLLSVLGSQGDAGQFRTPRHIIDFMVQLANPQKHETVLDPACGTAGFLISSYKHILKENCKKTPGDLLNTEERKKLLTNFKGYDISPDMVRLSLVNMYLHGFVQPQIMEYDTLTSEERWNEYADVILANPPFMSPKGGIKPHKKFSVQSNRSEVLFVDYIAEHLTPTGRAAIIVPEGIIFQSATAYKALRKMLVENHLYAVVSLPAGIFNPYSGVKTSILLMDRQLAKKTDSILFVKIENDGFGLGAQRREQTGSDLPDAVNVIKDYLTAFRNNKPESFITEEKPCSALLVKKEKLAENGEYNLTGDRYKTVETRKHQKWPLIELWEKTEIKKGSPITKASTVEGNIPVIAGGQEAAYFHNEANRNGKTITVSSSGAYAGFINYFKHPIFASDCTTIQTVSDEELDSDFLYRLLKSKQNNFYAFQQGMGQPHVYAKDFQYFKIPLPPLEVQREIVAEIESYQKLIDGCRQVVDSWKPQIDIDPEWPMVKLGDVCEITSSKRIFQEEYVSSGIPFYRTKEIVELSQGKDISLELFISEERYNEIKSQFGIPQVNDILISAVGTIGVSWIVSDDRQFYFKDGNLLWLKNINNALSPYIKVVLDYNIAQNLHLLTNGAAYNAMTIIKLKELTVPLPEIEVQQEIIAKIETERKTIDGCRELIKTYEDKIKRVIDKVWEE